MLLLPNVKVRGKEIKFAPVHWIACELRGAAAKTLCAFFAPRALFRCVFALLRRERKERESESRYRSFSAHSLRFDAVFLSFPWLSLARVYPLYSRECARARRFTSRRDLVILYTFSRCSLNFSTNLLFCSSLPLSLSVSPSARVLSLLLFFYFSVYLWRSTFRSFV